VEERILLVNPNCYQEPPVPPLGLEYLLPAVRSAGYEGRILDLCFSSNPDEAFRTELERYSPHAVGLTVRNVDSVLFPGTEFFLPRIRDLVRIAQDEFHMFSVIGGAALGAAPTSICHYVGADVAVVGPAEAVLPEVLFHKRELRGTGTIFQTDALTPYNERDISQTDYSSYLRTGAIAGFRTHCGCSRRCIYCLEAGSPSYFRRPVNVVLELATLVSRGLNHFHLCDPEFNEDLDYCINLLQLMEREKLGIRWTLYMRPDTYSGELFDRLAATGAYLITLSVCSWKRDTGYWNDVIRFVRGAQASGLRITMDLLTGFPYETKDSLINVLDFVRTARPNLVVINTFIRLYETLPITRIVRKDPWLSGHTAGDINGSLLEPVFYNHVPASLLEDLLHGEDNIKICGQNRGVNYQESGLLPNRSG